MSESLDLGGKRTLVIDDDFTIRGALRKILTAWGSQVTEAPTGAHGIIELKRARDVRKPFELVLLDATLSPMDGFEVLERMRAHPEEVARTILMVGPDRVAEEVARARALEVCSHVVKPLGRQAIFAAVSRVLRLENAQAPPLPKNGLRVLLAEDSSELRWIIRWWLEARGYQIDVAQDGGVAADLYRLIDYDVVLMDIQMPKYDGYWATRGIHEWERQNRMRHTPIIAMTAYAAQQNPAKNLGAGFDAFLVKPLTKEKLIAEIERRTKGGAATGSPPRSDNP